MRKPRLLAVALGVLTGFQAASLYAADWPQYRGLNQDGISAEKVNLTWPAAGPKVLWKVPTR
ncbi:MAG TPA: hypothetical protein VHP11_13405, partial [Tepidisphaeraceae bacterium]|nr:hypothetical protein [Tepidisphaeraceae bacterium]